MREMRINDHLTCFYSRESFDSAARSVRSGARLEDDDAGMNETKAVTRRGKNRDPSRRYTNDGNRSISGRKPRPRRPRKPTADPIVMTSRAPRGTRATSGGRYFRKFIKDVFVFDR